MLFTSLTTLFLLLGRTVCQTLNISFVLTSVCNHQIETTQEKYNAVVRDLFAPYLTFCSNQRSAIGIGTSVIGPLRVPCSVAQHCRDATAISDFVDNQLVEPSYVFYVLPKSMYCPFLGQALGPRTWILESGPPQVMLHELGHNLDLRHSMGPRFEEYGDHCSAMGACCSMRCFGAPHNVQLGWNDLLESWSLRDMLAGRTRHIIVPGQHYDPKSIFQIRINDTESLFLSYRQAASLYDRATACNNAVILHRFDGAKPQLLRVIGLQKIFDASPYFLQIRVVNMTDTHARVSLCRYESDQRTRCNTECNVESLVDQPAQTVATNHSLFRIALVNDSVAVAHLVVAYDPCASELGIYERGGVLKRTLKRKAIVDGLRFAVKRMEPDHAIVRVRPLSKKSLG